ncbi:MAG: metallophosphoesterase [Bacillota bacterium]
MIVSSFIAYLLLVSLGYHFAWRLILSAWPSLEKRRKRLLIFIIAPTLVFLASFFWMNFRGSDLAAYVYVASGLLFGLLTQLMIFGLIFRAGDWAKKSFSREKAGLGTNTARLAVFISLAFFLLGVYNAFFPGLKTIELEGWPPELSGKTFVQLSDLHLGAVYRPYWLKGIVSKVNDLDPDLVLISGDLADGSDRKVSEFAPALADIKAPAIFTPGNHDYYLPEEEMINLAKEGDLILLRNSATSVADMEIVGFDYLSRADSGIRRDIANLQATSSTRIVLNHVPVDQAEASALGARLMLSGHTHRGQIFPLSFLLRVIYGPYSYGLEQYEGMQTYTSAGTGTWGPLFRTLLPGEIILFRIK